MSRARIVSGLLLLALFVGALAWLGHDPATSDARGLFSVGSNLQSQPLYPGDAVVVPNQLDFETWGRALVRNLKDWSQIFAQFGLGIAAVKTLGN